MMTAEQESLLLDLLATTFKRQRGFELLKDDLLIELSPPYENSEFTIKVETKRKDDNLRLLAVVRSFSSSNSIGTFYFTQYQGYSTGKLDDVYVIDLILDRMEYNWLLRLSQTKAFKDQVVNADQKMYFPDSANYLTFEDGTPVLYG